MKDSSSTAGEAESVSPDKKGNPPTPTTKTTNNPPSIFMLVMFYRVCWAGASFRV
jgi:hypothetical protein